MKNFDRNDVLSWISDLYKDVHGIRPRGYNFHEWSDSELEVFVNDLEQQAKAEAEYEANMAKQAELDFEEKVQDIINVGAGNRETALRWMLQGDMGDEKELDLYGIEWFTMSRGIDYTDTGRKVEKELITIANKNRELFGMEA